MPRRIAGICGIVSPFIALAVLLIAVSSSPWFSWTEYNLSILGVEDSSAGLFNAGLVLVGVLSVTFTIGLRKGLISSRLGELGIANLMLGSIALAATGIFPGTMDLPHDMASGAFFALVTLAFFLVGVAAMTASHTAWGLSSLTASVLIIVLRLIPWPWDGGAIPQLLYCLPWSLWTIIFGIGLLVKSSPVDVKE